MKMPSATEPFSLPRPAPPGVVHAQGQGSALTPRHEALSDPWRGRETTLHPHSHRRTRRACRISGRGRPRHRRPRHRRQRPRQPEHIHTLDGRTLCSQRSNIQSETPSTPASVPMSKKRGFSPLPASAAWLNATANTWDFPSTANC